MFQKRKTKKKNKNIATVSDYGATEPISVFFFFVFLVKINIEFPETRHATGDAARPAIGIRRRRRDLGHFDGHR